MTSHKKQQPDYEYVVVGSGAGGGPLAANLAKAGHKILLLEAGGAAEPYNYQVPVFHGNASEDDSLKWDFFVRHYSDDELQRRDSKFTEKQNGVLYPRAGTLGGCTAHNAMITVYPHNSDWDYIADLMNDPSWASDNMRKYFERLDNCHYRPVRRFLQKVLGWNPTRHGFRGWLASSLANPFLIFRDKTLLNLVARSAAEAFESLGNPLGRLKRSIKGLLDPNDWRLVKRSAEGIRYAPLATDGGQRTGTREYIRRVQSAFPENLSVRTNCLVTKVLFDDNNRAIGVEYLRGENLYRASAVLDTRDDAGERHEVYVSREVILSGGAFNTPQLLKLSGVGPKEELERHGIPTRIDLPGVGENLQDRYEVGIVNRMKSNFTLIQGDLRAPEPGEAPNANFVEWQTGKGPYTTNGAVLAVIKRSTETRPEPDLFIFGLPIKFKGYFPGYSEAIRTERNYFTWAVLKAHTQNSAGRVTLRSSDPRDVPDVNFHYFDEGNDAGGEDLESVVDGVEFVRDMTARVSDLIEEEEVPGAGVSTRDQIREFVKNEAWGHHASCTCKIGTEDDEMAVLDSDFRVYGTKNLRVVDASVFPKIPGFFIVSSVYMISEKASDVILADAGNVDAAEQEDIDRIIRLQQAKLVKDYQNTRSLRDTHPKSNGLIRTEFVVEPDLREDLRVGLFKEPCTYKAWMRFSNSAPEVTPDHEKDFRGLAIKLFGVAGEKLLDDELHTHDFLFIAHDAFFAANPKDFGDFFNTIINGRATKLFGRPIGLKLGYFLTRGTLRHLRNTRAGLRVHANPLEIDWFSVAPYRFGTRVVKYSVRASGETGYRPSEIPENPGPDYLTDAMRRTLADRDFSLDFMIQFQTDPDTMPIDDTTIPWDERRSPFIKVATIRIPSQEFGSQEQREFDENLSFNPWHCLPEHRPLGAINRARRQVMLSISDLRLKRNNVPRVEPTGP